MFATTNLRRPALTLIVALSLVALTTLGAQEIGPASAGAPLLVTKTADTNDGTCDADCSLREAIVAANAAGGADTITLPAGTYTLVIAGMGEDASATGDLDITDQLIIAGQTAVSTVIQGGVLAPARIAGTGPIDRVFHVLPGVSFQLRDVTVRHGKPPDPDDGGGILNEGTLDIRDSTIIKNVAKNGGGLFNDAGTVDIDDVIFTANHALSAAGGVDNQGGAITISGSEISNNTADSHAGGIRTQGDGATLAVDDTRISGNTNAGSDGGGMYFVGDVSVLVTNSEISGNSASSNGGGIHTSGDVDLTVIDSTISENSAGSNGGGLRLCCSGTIELTNTTISDNMAVRDGGGINASTNLNLTNVTVSGNSADRDGGGLGVQNHTTTIINSTITNNTADSDSIGDDGDGGGVWVDSDPGKLLVLKNSIISGNFDLTSDPDCFGPVNVEARNLIGSPSSNCNLIGDSSEHWLGFDPLLGPLADNGGSTKTHVLLEGSVAIDWGLDCPPPETDQRGVARPIGDDCDLGAYESEFGATPTPSPTPTSTPASSLTQSPTPAATPTPTASPSGGDRFWGDNNCSQQVDPVDSLFVLRGDAGLPTDTGDCPDMGQVVDVQNASPHPWGDVDCGGEVTPVDSLKILRFDAGLGVSQEAACPLIGSEVQVAE